TDHIGSIQGTVGGWGLRVQGADYIVAGPDVGEVKLAASHPLAGPCAIAFSYERLWPGFRDTFPKAGLACSMKAFGGMFSATPAIAHSAHFDRTIANLQFSQSWPIAAHVAFDVFGKGYARKGGKDLMIGLKLTVTP